jgi:hypothetical protein
MNAHALTSLASADPNEGVLLDVTAIDNDSKRWWDALSKLADGIPDDPLEMNVEVNIIRREWSKETMVALGPDIPNLSPPCSTKGNRTKPGDAHKNVDVDESSFMTPSRRSTVLTETLLRSLGRNTKPKKKSQSVKHVQKPQCRWHGYAGGYTPTSTKPDSECSSVLSRRTKDFANSFFSDDVRYDSSSSRSDSIDMYQKDVCYEQANLRNLTPLPLSYRVRRDILDPSFFEWLNN